MRSLQSGGAKRARTVQAANEATGASSALSQGPVVDLGKALASLDKPALLNVFSKLLTTSPHLAFTIASFLPAPTLSNILDSLNSLEHAVIEVTPTGSFLRPEYIFSRVRLQLEEYVSEAKRYLSLFVPAQQPTGALSEDNLAHPSTAFQFLHALTSSLLRLESTLPSSPSASLTPSSPPSNPLAGHLVPLTLNAWHLFITRLSSAINTQGRVLPTSLAQSWFDQVDALAVSSFLGAGIGGERASQVRKAMEGVRERMRREVGWLVGFKSEVAGVGGSNMEGVEQEEEL
ncbi:nuclear envelope, Cut8 family protein [Rhodotorula toruloides]|uniref:Tethering factor for nuclear proteasome STS1 n=1 Tax=Rhodotorula toruloides TaxID=5286 RepID=A0A511KNV8_RHOTO|nr:nuclear envelope, Cut8 family protein [Rhodotorula toruloides]